MLNYIFSIYNFDKWSYLRFRRHTNQHPEDILRQTTKILGLTPIILKFEFHVLLQGYSSKDKKGNLFDDWDLSEARGTELSEVPLLSLPLSLPPCFIKVGHKNRTVY